MIYIYIYIYICIHIEPSLRQLLLLVSNAPKGNGIGAKGS